MSVLRIKTAGLNAKEEMLFHAGRSQCGNIKDGVAFDIGRGAWVVDFNDLQRMVALAIKCREFTGFRVGDSVIWESQSSGFTKKKSGVIVEVVPPHERPTDEHRPKGAGWGRSEESYVVKVGKKTYWPLVRHLQLVKRKAA